MVCDRSPGAVLSTVVVFPSGQAPDAARIAGHDGVRGIAILLVFHHATVLAPSNAIEMVLARLAAFGVGDLFLARSGFLITGILLDTRGGRCFRTFCARRALRTLLLYYFLIAFAVLAVPFLLSHFPQSSGTTARVLIPGRDSVWSWSYYSNFLIAAQNGFRNGLLDPSWSLSIEERFWAPVIWFLSPSALRKLCIGILAVALGALCAIRARSAAASAISSPRMQWLAGFSGVY